MVLKTSKERSVSFNYFHAIITTTNIIDQYKVLLTVDKALFTLRARSRVIFLFKWPLVQTYTMKRPPTTWPVPGSKIAVQCSRTVESYAKRKKPRGCWERECAPPPFPDTALLIFAWFVLFSRTSLLSESLAQASDIASFQKRLQRRIFL